MKLVDEYMNWVTGSMDERFHDDQWMKRFTRCKVDLEDAAANDADVESYGSHRFSFDGVLTIFLQKREV